MILMQDYGHVLFAIDVTSSTFFQGKIVYLIKNTHG